MEEDKLLRLMMESGLHCGDQDDSSGDEWTPENSGKTQFEKSIMVHKVEIHQKPESELKLQDLCPKNINAKRNSPICSNITEKKIRLDKVVESDVFTKIDDNIICEEDDNTDQSNESISILFKPAQFGTNTNETKKDKNTRLNEYTGELETELENYQINDIAENEIETLGVEEGHTLRAEEPTTTQPINKGNNKQKLLNFETGEFETDSESNNVEENVNLQKGKKKTSRSWTWTKNRNKQKKLKDHTLQEIPVCRCKCKDKISKTQIESVFQKFISLNNHTEQNIYLQGCLKECVPSRHRPRKKQNRERRVFKYYIKIKNESIEVCQKTFLCIHGIKRDRLQFKVQHPEKDINDGRGKHQSNVVYTEEVILKIHKFIEDLPARASHYSRASSKHRKYLDSHLTITALHKKFVDDNPDIHVTYDRFRDIFNKDFNISFATPRKDICSTCEKYKIDIEAAELKKNKDLVQKLKTDQELHLRKADVFLKKYSKCEKEKDDHKLCICFDYQKNLPLPVTNISDEYYLRQLWLHNFGIHNLSEGTATMHLYTENFALKGPNEVISALDDYITHNKKDQQTHLEIYCDNCFSQNKNRYLFAYLDQLCALGIFEKITVFYPIPGHSMMPIDRDFALIERKRLKYEKIYSPEDYVQIIKESKKQNKFEIVYLEKSLLKIPGEERVVKVKDFKTLYNNYVKPTIPGISTCRQVVFMKHKRPEFSASMNGTNLKTFVLYKVGFSRIIRQLPEDTYTGQLKIKSAKVEDIKKLIKYVPESEREFYNDIIIFSEIDTNADDEKNSTEEIE